MLNFPKPTSGRRFGKSSMNIVLNFPNALPGIRFGKLSRFSGARWRAHSRASAGAPRPLTGPPPLPAPPLPRGRDAPLRPDLPSKKRGRRRLKADDGCATRYDPTPPTESAVAPRNRGGMSDRPRMSRSKSGATPPVTTPAPLRPSPPPRYSARHHPRATPPVTTAAPLRPPPPPPHGDQPDPDLLNFPNPIGPTTFGKLSMTVVPNFPELDPGFRFGDLSRFLGPRGERPLPETSAPHSAPRSGTHLRPEVGHTPPPRGRAHTSAARSGRTPAPRPPQPKARPAAAESRRRPRYPATDPTPLTRVR